MTTFRALRDLHHAIVSGSDRRCKCAAWQKSERRLNYSRASAAVGICRATSLQVLRAVSVL